MLLQEQESIAALQQLGLTQSEAKIYLALLQDNPANGHQVSKNAGVPSAKVYENLERLRKRQLVASVRDSNDYIPLPLEEFFKDYQHRFDNLSDKLRDNIREQSSRIQGEILWQGNGYQALMKRSKEYIDKAEREVLASAWPVDIAELLAALDAASARAVPTYMIVYGSVAECQAILARASHPQNLYLFPHSPLPNMEQVHGKQANLVIDRSIAIMMDGAHYNDWHGVWTGNPAVIQTTKNYIWHDIYVNKIAFAASKALETVYGKDLTELLDLTSGSVRLGD